MNKNLATKILKSAAVGREMRGKNAPTRPESLKDLHLHIGKLPGGGKRRACKTVLETGTWGENHER